MLLAWDPASCSITAGSAGAKEAPWGLKEIRNPNYGDAASQGALPELSPPRLLSEVCHRPPCEGSSTAGALLMNIHAAAAVLSPVLCNYHFKGSQTLIGLEHDLSER